MSGLSNASLRAFAVTKRSPEFQPLTLTFAMCYAGMQPITCNVEPHFTHGTHKYPVSYTENIPTDSGNHGKHVDKSLGSCSGSSCRHRPACMPLNDIVMANFVSLQPITVQPRSTSFEGTVCLATLCPPATSHADHCLKHI